MNILSCILISLLAFVAGGCTTTGHVSTEPEREVQEPRRAEPVVVQPQSTSGLIKFRLDEKILAEAQEKYGIPGRHRLKEWEELIRTDNSRTDMEKLIKVNTFINRFPFIDDNEHWGRPDYWATPVEFLASNGGDCEDFSVAKYFTLKAMGVNERRLYLTYVKNLSIDDFHMVMTYFEMPGIRPLVLDNLINDIKPAAERPNLLPVYSINGTGLFMAQQMNSLGRMVGTSDELNRWKELLTRIPEELK